MTLEIVACLLILAYFQVTILVYANKKLEARLYEAIKQSKSPKGRAQVAKKEAAVKKDLVLKSILWPLTLVAKDDKKS